jgi:L-ascorbate metabolism protein UlaG (beta-lactamase superfamily)
VPAKHNEIERDENGRCKFMGYVIGFGDWKIYHSGDTLWFDGMVELLKSFKVDVALLPINGNDPSRGVAGNLNVKEAAALGKAIETKLVIPCHYDMFTFNTADPKDFANEAEKINQAYQILKPGGHFSNSFLNV